MHGGVALAALWLEHLNVQIRAAGKHAIRRLRTRLIEEGALVPVDSRYRFARDVLFATPSSAACVVLGRSANGRTELIDETGRTLKSIEEGY